MRKLHLTPRLLTAASFVRPADRLLDIGTDHARLPVYLTERGLCAAATATDTAPGPLNRAMLTLRKHRLEGRIPLLLCDGGLGLDADEYDTVTITGMGGDTILSILEQSPWLWDKRLILQPQTRVERFAAMNPSQHTTIAEGHRVYHIFLFEGTV